MIAQPNTPASRFYKVQADSISHLYARWLDERQYEDPSDYDNVLSAWMAEFDLTLTSGITRRSFSFQFVDKEGREYRMWRTARELGYARIA